MDLAYAITNNGWYAIKPNQSNNLKKKRIFLFIVPRQKLFVQNKSNQKIKQNYGKIETTMLLSFGLISLFYWHINHHGLFNAKANLEEEQ